MVSKGGTYSFVIRYKERRKVHNRKTGGKNMSIKKKLGMGVATAALGLSLVAGGTFAYFNDEAKAESTFATGTLQLGLSSGDKESAAFSFENFKPGDVKKAEIHLTNEGSLDIGKVTLDANLKGDDELVSEIYVTATPKNGGQGSVEGVSLENIVEMEEEQTILAKNLKSDDDEPVIYEHEFEIKDTGKPQDLQDKRMTLETTYTAIQER